LLARITAFREVAPIDLPRAAWPPRRLVPRPRGPEPRFAASAAWPRAALRRLELAPRGLVPWPRSPCRTWARLRVGPNLALGRSRRTRPRFTWNSAGRSPRRAAAARVPGTPAPVAGASAATSHLGRVPREPARRLCARLPI